MKKLASFLFQLSAYRIALAVGLLCLGLDFQSINHAGDLPLLGRVEMLFKNIKFHERGVLQSPRRVAIAALDEKSIEKYGRLPWDRSRIARLVDALTDQGAAVVAFDMTFSDVDSAAQSASEHYNALLKPSALFSPRGDEVVQALTKLKSNPPVSGAVDLLLKLRAEQQAALASNAESGPDHALAQAIAKNGHVVMGMIGLTKRDAAGQSTNELRGLVSRVSRSFIDDPYYEIPGGNAAFPLDPGVKVDVAHFVSVESALPEIAAASASFGAFNAKPDEDGVIRRAPLVSTIDGHMVPSLELAAAAMALKSSTLTPYTPAGSNPYIEFVELKEANVRVPVHHGAMSIVYYGPEGAIERVSAADLIDGQVAPGYLKDKVVIVAATAQGTFDQRVTPFDKIAAGVETHASAVENILERRFLQRTLWTNLVELGVIVLLAVLFGFIFSKVNVRIGLPVMALTGLGYHGLDYALFRAGYEVTSFLPLFELGVIFVLVTVFRYATEEKDKRKLRKAFQLYLNEEVMEEMLADPAKLQLGGKEVDITVLFSDIRGFTTISEKLTAQQLVQLLNEYLSPMTDLVFKHNGTLDKYIGDAVMAFFGAPLERPDNAFKACQCAVEMMSTLEQLKLGWREAGYPPIDIGIGLNAGSMVAGNMGSTQRFNYTVMGDNVNLGSRLEGLNKEYGTHIIISEFTLSRAQKNGAIHTRKLDLVRVKGKEEPVRIYELRGIGNVPAAEVEWLAKWNEALALYRGQLWNEAMEMFRTCAAMNADDRTSPIYVERCEAMRDNPPGADWDGVMKMTHK